MTIEQMLISDQVFLRLGDAFISTLPATIAAIAALITAWRGVQKTKEVKKIVNGRMDQLLELTKIMAQHNTEKKVIQAINDNPELPNVHIESEGQEVKVIKTS